MFVLEELWYNVVAIESALKGGRLTSSKGGGDACGNWGSVDANDLIRYPRRLNSIIPQKKIDHPWP